MPCRFVCIENVRDFRALHFDEIGNERAMTSPPKPFCAHERSPTGRFCAGKQPLDSVTKFLRFHVIGITAKCGAAPRKII